jgi:hypothetical protein
MDKLYELTDLCNHKHFAIIVLNFTHPPDLIWLVGFMVLNATFDTILVISWRLILLVEETGGPRENHRPAASH